MSMAHAIFSGQISLYPSEFSVARSFFVILSQLNVIIWGPFPATQPKITPLEITPHHSLSHH